MKPKLEVACFTLHSAKIAIQAEVDRIEFCADGSSGGITPNIDEIKELCSITSIPIYVMIRPRGGNFCYTSDEFTVMKQQIMECKNLGVSGFVFGILTENNAVDIKRNSELVQVANPFPCTFHRAFDRVNNWQVALSETIECGFSTILTSGLHDTASEGIHILQQLCEAAQNKMVIMPGGSIRSSNIQQIQTQTQTSFYHTSGIIETNGEADLQELKSILKILRNA